MLIICVELFLCQPFTVFVSEFPLEYMFTHKSNTHGMGLGEHENKQRLFKDSWKGWHVILKCIVYVHKHGRKLDSFWTISNFTALGVTSALNWYLYCWIQSIYNTLLTNNMISFIVQYWSTVSFIYYSEGHPVIHLVLQAMFVFKQSACTVSRYIVTL